MATASESPGRQGSRRGVPVVVEGSPEWVAWLDQLARRCRLSRAATLDRGLVALAEAVGFDAPPDRWPARRAG